MQNSKILFVDTHAHLTAPPLLAQAREILVRAQEVGVDHIVNICTDEESLREGLALRAEFPWVHLAAATTPHDVEAEGESFFSVVARAAQTGQLVAIGETGLDYFYEHADKAVQRLFLSRYFELAKQKGLPLVFHCREAFDDLFAMADVEYKDFPALLHCFTGTLDEAKRVLDRGWLISLSGIVTFKKAEVLKEVASYVPLDKLVIETDSPYLAPLPHRGKPNEPAFVIEVAKLIAFLKGISLERCAEATSANAARFFRY